MPSPKFERVKAEHAGIATLLDNLAKYIRHRLNSGDEYVLPKLAAAALALNEGEAFVLLELLVKAGLLRRQYNIYCRNHDVIINSVDSVQELSQVQECDFCDCEHQPSAMRVEIAFRPDGKGGNGGLQ